MQAFTDLFLAIDQSTKTTKKLEALVRFFEKASDEDKVWAIALLSGKRPKRAVRSGNLRNWTAEISGLPAWLFEETYHIVGDLAETIAKILPPAEHQVEYSLSDWMSFIQSLSKLDPQEKKAKVLWAWNHLDPWSCFVFNKMMMGGFRIGVSQKLTVKALAQYTGKEESDLAHRLMGNWQADAVDFKTLIIDKKAADDLSKPYPFYLAYQIDSEVEELGKPELWQAEPKWDGIRGQLIIRGGKHYLWSRGEELISDKFPEFDPSPSLIPDGTVFDGELLAYRNDQTLGFQELQPRISRKNLSKKILQEAPVIMRVYDLLEWKGKDLRERPQAERRELLEQVFAELPDNQIFQLSPKISFSGWDELREIRSRSREEGHEGIMLKRKEGIYQVGRKKGDWWKWKVEPLSIDAVLIYGMRGHGRRANLYTDYTFAVWDGDKLVPFTKAYSGLTDAEFREVDRFIKQNTIERFGPVRSVKPELVFEIAFEGIQASKRHKSGIALRFPRMKRWRKDKKANEANRLSDLKDLLKLYPSASQ